MTARVDKNALRTGSRVASDEYSKDDVRDFALWKRATPEDEAVGAAWDAPFGRGRPGWHLECSAMALREVGVRFNVPTLDIHSGAVDLIFPHHENEIAQSEGATGQPFVRCWLHGEFLTVAGTKMSKRYGNILTARDLREEGVDAAAVRLLIFSTHYRQQLNFTDAALEAASEGVRRLGEFRKRLALLASTGPDSTAPEVPDSANAVAGADSQVLSLVRGFEDAMDDDLNVPKAIGHLFSFVTASNRELDRGGWPRETTRKALEALDRVTAARSNSARKIASRLAASPSPPQRCIRKDASSQDASVARKAPTAAATKAAMSATAVLSTVRTRIISPHTRRQGRTAAP